MNVTITCRLVDPDKDKDQYKLLLNMDGILSPEVSFEAFKTCVLSAVKEYLPDSLVFRFTMSMDFRDELANLKTKKDS